jgi:hypothetical protein
MAARSCKCWHLQICRYDVDRRGEDNLSVKFYVPQRQGSLFAALYLIMNSFVVKSIECTYSLSPEALAFLLSLSSRRPDRLTTLRLYGTRCDFDTQMTECLAESLRQASNLARVSLARVWISGSPAKDVLRALAACTSLTCVAALILFGRLLAYYIVNRSFFGLPASGPAASHTANASGSLTV